MVVGYHHSRKPPHRLETVHARNLAEWGTISVLDSKAQNNFERQGDSPSKPPRKQKTLSPIPHWNTACFSWSDPDMFMASSKTTTHNKKNNETLGIFGCIPICFFPPAKNWRVKPSFNTPLSRHLDIVWAHTIHLKIQFLKILAKLLTTHGGLLRGSGYWM